MTDPISDKPASPTSAADDAGAVANAAPRKWSPNLEGAVWMLASGLFFTIYLALTKHLAEDFSAAMLGFTRGAVGFLFTAPLLMRAGAAAWRLNRPGLVILRGALGSAGFFLSIAAVADLPLSQFNAISFSRPLFVVALAAFLLGERVGPRRISATLVGFLGVLIIVQPGGGVDAATIMALTSSLFFAAGIILVKTLSRDNSSLTLLLYANIITVLFLAPFAAMAWTTPEGWQWALMAAMALSGTLAQGCYIRGMALGDASFVTNMDFLRLPMTVFADWAVFRALPTFWVWPGAALIVGAALYISVREARLGGKKPVKAPASP